MDLDLQEDKQRFKRQTTIVIVRIICKDVGMKFGIKNCGMLLLKIDKVVI